MFRNTHQRGFLTVFSSSGSKPLSIWKSHVKNGHIKRLTDYEINSLVLELAGKNVATTFIYAPCPGFCSLAVKLPFLVMILKNMQKFFTFEIQILDDQNQLRRFRVSNYLQSTRVKPFCTSMPLCLSPGWNQIQFNLADFVRRAYGTSYIETTRIQIHANVRVKRIYFCDRLYNEEEKPSEYCLHKSGHRPDKRAGIKRDFEKSKGEQEEAKARPSTPKTDEPEASLVKAVSKVSFREQIETPIEVKLEEEEPVADEQLVLEAEPEVEAEPVVEEKSFPLQAEEVKEIAAE